MVTALETAFPGLQGTAYHITSPPDEVYNCVAWAAGKTDDWWWPVVDPQRAYWPSGVPRVVTLEAFRMAFATLAYEVCSSTDHQVGFEKIAVFANSEGMPQHVARQLPNGRWTSKLGKMADIEHQLRALEGAVYGSVVLFLKRLLVTHSYAKP
jgi:hypothetical protein